MQSLSLKLIAALALVVGFSANVHAGPVYGYDIDNPPGSDGGGDILNISTTYDTNTEVFNWSYTIKEKAPGVISDGFWLVISDGPNPKSHVNEYAILYGDLANNRVTAYEYSGQNNANSYNSPGVLLGSFGGLDAVDNGSERTLSFSIDATGINNHAIQDWKGLFFGEQIGIWFHPSVGTNVSYYKDGGISSFSYAQGGQGWYDTGYRQTYQVPEPSTLALLGIGMGALLMRRRTIK